MPTANTSSRSRAKNQKKIRIVIADDHAMLRDGLRKILSLERDLEVIGEAQDGQQTVELVKELQPDILLLDLKMPVMSGLTALEQIHDRMKSTRVIVLTASEPEEEVVQAVRLGTAGVVGKQEGTELLLKSIRKVASGEIWLDSRLTAAVMRKFSGPAPPPREQVKSLLSGREREIVILAACV